MKKSNKVEVINEVNGNTYGASFETQEEATTWIDLCITKQSWGKPERSFPKESLTEELTEELISRVISEYSVEYLDNDTQITTSVAMVTVMADYVITQTDLNLSKAYRNSKQVEARKEEYKSIEEVMHIILDHGLDSQEYSDLQAERAAIKVKYGKE